GAGLAAPARTREEIRVRDAVRLHRHLERARNVLLPDHVIERERSPLSGKNLVAHINPSSSLSSSSSRHDGPAHVDAVASRPMTIRSARPLAKERRRITRRHALLKMARAASRSRLSGCGAERAYRRRPEGEHTPARGGQARPRHMARSIYRCYLPVLTGF